MKTGSPRLLFLIAAALAGSASPASAAPSLLQDGTFLQPIGTGPNLTPWSDWTSAGVTQSTAPGIPGNYAILPKGADLFQRFTASTPGVYRLSFLVQNPMAWSAEMITDVQEPLGFGWHLLDKVLDLPANSGWIRESITFVFNKPAGTPSEFYFSNSYNYPDANRGFGNSINPSGTFLWVADVSLTRVPEPATWAMMIGGLGLVGSAIRRRGMKLASG
ncbi:PEPxxWA-CTERM sorting domain-containing protein [Sphingomonas tabacisoli]|uniref:PEPxxWA-CTERM sorting domain-containing protein n=1 Tax=Sphingomonas tabacisoli TaxID=2249466 RepID=A0ABW4I4K2_9SPHN